MSRVNLKRNRFKIQRREIKRAKKRKKKRKEEKDKLLKGQFVDVAPTEDDRPPEKTRFLSEYNTRVKKETVSRYRKLKYKISAPKPTKRIQRAKSKRLAMLQSRSAAKLREKKKRRSKRRTPKKMKEKKITLPPINRSPALERGQRGRYRDTPQNPILPGLATRLKLDVGKLSILSPRSGNVEENKGTQQGKRTTPELSQLDLKPDPAVLSKIEGSPAPDYIEDIPEGDATALNTRRSIYATFFNRVKQRVAQHWRPLQVYMRRDPYGNIYGTKDRYTLLGITLNPKGEIINLEVLSPSGLEFLDREAIRAFRAAQPFPNPPRDLIKNGKLSFKFGFMLTITARPKLLFFR